MEDKGAGALAARLMADALLFQPSTPLRTRGFARLRHDKDLLPGLQRRLDILLAGFHRDTKATLDIQGFTDEGTDVLVRVHAGEVTEFLCLQVKSHVEITQPKLANELLLQWQRSVDRYKPLRYYILLFADLASAKHQRAIRSVESAFVKKPAVSVVTPVYLATFWRLRSDVMDALATSVHRSGDPLIADAGASLMELDTAPQAGLVLALLANHVVGKRSVSREALGMSDWFVKLVCSVEPLSPYWENPPTNLQKTRSLLRTRSNADSSVYEQRLTAILAAIEEDLDLDEGRGQIALADPWHPLVSLMHEAVAKYDLTGDALIRYMLTLLYR